MRVELDAEMVERARLERAYLLDGTQASAGLTEHDAERIAYEELRSSRRKRGAA